MSRTVLWIVTIFLSLAMIALVAVQAYWIKHSIKSEENQLGLVVNQVLSEISNELVQNDMDFLSLCFTILLCGYTMTPFCNFLFY